MKKHHYSCKKFKKYKYVELYSTSIEGKSDISLSAGNTGVLLVISRMILKMMNEVSKPALAGLWPSQNGMNVVLDLGANIECNDQNLSRFC
jgi:glycerol-3-phosphate acyltransferase PlsX